MNATVQPRGAAAAGGQLGAALRSRSRQACWLGAMVLVVGAARADALPGKNSVDAHCTLEEQCSHGTFCNGYGRSKTRTPEEAEALAAAAAACAKRAEKSQLKQRCSDVREHRTLFCPPGERGTWTRRGGDDEESRPGPPAKPIASDAGDPRPSPEAPAPRPAPAQAAPSAPGAGAAAASNGCGCETGALPRGDGVGIAVVLLAVLGALRWRASGERSA